MSQSARGLSSTAAAFAAWLTPRRLRAQAIVLALCLWSICAFDLATPGMFDRAGNIKYQDFIQFYVAARLITQGRASQLFDHQVTFDELRRIVFQTSILPPSHVRLPPVYGPQVGLLFVPFTRLAFLTAAPIWSTLSLLAYFACIYVVWKSSANLREHPRIVALAAVAFPPIFHTFIRGQITVLLLACFTTAWLAFRADRPLLAGLALGLLVCKPQFLVAIPVILLLAGAWRALAGTILSAAAQLGLALMIFGSAIMRAYFSTLWHMSSYMEAVEPGRAAIQMHSLRSFWLLLIPEPTIAKIIYVASSIAVVILAAAIWKSSSDMAVRFSALTLAAVLVNPHLFVYDLLVLAPVLLLLADWTLSLSSIFLDQFRGLTYLAFVLPLLGPLSRWTHIQLSVIGFVVLLWLLWRESTEHASSTIFANP
ncbi:MAG: glycosyltransferase family 87 protein [Candidatus Sulfotelmatobacter sp.]